MVAWRRVVQRNVVALGFDAFPQNAGILQVASVLIDADFQENTEE